MSQNILIIEDDETLREGLEIVLSDLGYNVKSVSDFIEFTNTQKKFQADLYLIDYRLPGINGLAITSKLRKNDKQVPIIIMSASSNDIQKQIKKAGANAFIRKPFNLESLTELIKLFTQ